MKHYVAYFEKIINRISFIVLLFYISGVLVDWVIGNETHPAWITYSSYPIGIVSVICFLLSVFRVIPFRISALICIYMMIVFFYIPGFIDPTYDRPDTINYFSTLSVCAVCLFFAGLIGSGRHVLYLGMLNIGLYLSLLWFFAAKQGDFYTDIINILAFTVLPVIVYILFRHINVSIIENENNKRRLEEAEKEILKLKIEEEKRRNHYLSVMQESNLQLLDKVEEKFNSLLANKIESRTDFAAEIQKMKNLCHIHLNVSRNSENARWQQHTDIDFISKLRVKYPQLSVKEQYICSLIWARLSTKEIAAQMKISIEGVKWHRKHIRKKMDVKSDESLTEILNEMDDHTNEVET